MKTQTVSLLAFHNKVKELAEKAGKRGFSANAEITTYSIGTSVLEFKCWVVDYQCYIGSTPTEALTKLRNAMFPPKQSISDVMMEVEGGEEV